MTDLVSCVVLDMIHNCLLRESVPSIAKTSIVVTHDQNGSVASCLRDIVVGCASCST